MFYLNAVLGEGELQMLGVFPSCAITHAMAQKGKQNGESPLYTETSDKYPEEIQAATNSEEGPALTGKIIEKKDKVIKDADGSPVLTHNQLIQDQQADPELATLAQEALTEEEEQVNPVCYFKKSGILMWKWRPPNIPATDDWKVTYQNVIPRNCHKDVLELAHSTPMAGYLGGVSWSE